MAEIHVPFWYCYKKRKHLLVNIRSFDWIFFNLFLNSISVQQWQQTSSGKNERTTTWIWQQHDIKLPVVMNTKPFFFVSKISYIYETIGRIVIFRRTCLQSFWTEIHSFFADNSKANKHFVVKLSDFVHFITMDKMNHTGFKILHLKWVIQKLQFHSLASSNRLT